MKLDVWLDECDAHMLKAAGVYAILDEDSNVLYVGETDSFIKRWGQHCNPVEIHRPVPLHDIYKFVVLEYVDDRPSRITAEQAWMDELLPFYNKRYGAALARTRTTYNQIKRRKLNEALKAKDLEVSAYDPPVDEDRLTSLEEQELTAMRQKWIHNDD